MSPGHNDQLYSYAKNHLRIMSSYWIYVENFVFICCVHIMLCCSFLKYFVSPFVFWHICVAVFMSVLHRFSYISMKSELGSSESRYPLPCSSMTSMLIPSHLSSWSSQSFTFVYLRTLEFLDFKRGLWPLGKNDKRHSVENWSLPIWHSHMVIWNE